MPKVFKKVVHPMANVNSAKKETREIFFVLK